MSARIRRLAGPIVCLAALALLLSGCGLPGVVASRATLPAPAPSPTATPLPPIQFPRDEAPHHDLEEWWYVTGHLSGTDARGQTQAYGFELTFFQTLRGTLPPYYAAHFAVSDLTRGQFHFAQREGFEPASVIPPSGSTGGFDLALGGWTMRGVNGHDQLAATMSGYGITLTLSDLLPRPILESSNGLISYGPAGFSYYYSRPLMAVRGTMLDHGTALPVSGQAWFDHQWGNFLLLSGSGWDWYSIQLSNRTEYMLYVLYDDQHRPLSTIGTAIAADGSSHPLAAREIHTVATGSWRSPATGAVYPSGWRVTLDTPAVSLTLTPALRDQELVVLQSTGNAYWEGAVRISGTAEGQPVTGAGYVELTGYAKTPATAPGT